MNELDMQISQMCSQIEALTKITKKNKKFDGKSLANCILKSEQLLGDNQSKKLFE